MTADNDKTKPTQPVVNATSSQSGPVLPQQEHTRPSSERQSPGVLQPLNETKSGQTQEGDSTVKKGAVAAERSSSKDTIKQADAQQAQHAKDVNKMDTVSGSSTKPEQKSAGAADARRPAATTAAADVTTEKTSGRSGAAGWVAGAAAVIAVMFAAGLWWQNQRFDAVSREVASRLQTSDLQLVQLTRDVQTALSQSNKQSEQLKTVIGDVKSIRSEMLSIDQTWQSAGKTLDDRLLVSYLRRLLNLSQQLVLTGHISGAISALESALEMLQGHQAPEQFVALTSAIGADLERLRAMPVVDVNELALQLGRVVGLVEKAPLQVPDRVAPGLSPIQHASATNQETASAADAGETTDATSPWWKTWLGAAQQTGTKVLQIASREFSDLMQVRRADMPQTLLLSEEQAMLVRTNLRSMLLGAQLALLNRQASIWQAELGSVTDMLNTYYDPESTDVKAALKLVAALRESPITVEAKPITESLSALAVAAQTVTVPAISGESH